MKRKFFLTKIRIALLKTYQNSQRPIAWLLLIGGLVGFGLSAIDLLAPNEPKLVLLLSWGALIYEGYNGVQIAEDSK
jgi:hypothetical protein